MRNVFRLVSAVGVAGALATSAQAIPFSGSVTFQFSTISWYALTVSGSGNGASTTAPNLLAISSTAWAATGPVRIEPLVDPTPPILNVVLTAPGPCTFTGTPIGGPCALGGTANVLVGGAPFLVVPLSGIGVAGRHAFGPYGSYIDAQPWQTGVVPITVNGVTLTTNITTPVTATGVPIVTTGYDNRNAAGVGTVKLVAPAGLMSTLIGELPLFASMTLSYVPEPGTLLLLGTGVVGLALLGRRRMRR